MTRRTGLLLEGGALVTAAVAIALVVRINAIDVAGDADSYGYVSEAVRLSGGHFYESERVFAPFGLAENSRMTFPLGYTSRGSDGTVPTYPFGYPLLMAVMIRIFGIGAAYWVSCMLASGAAVATYVAGRVTLGRVGGVLAAGLVVILPNFLWDALFPMSDVPATFFAAAAVAVLLYPKPKAWLDLLLGVVEGYGIWIRPNLLLLTIPTVLWLSWRRDWTRLIRFGLGIFPFVAIEVVVNQSLYGSAVLTGYGSIPLAPSFADAAERAVRHLGRLNDQQAGLGLALVALGLVFGRLPIDRRALLLGFGAVLLIFFAFYAIDDAWWYGRFLLPGLPAIAVLEASALIRLLDHGPTRFLRSSLLVAGLTWFGLASIAYARDRDVFTRADGELRYLRVASIGREQIKQPAVVLTMQHSGTLRYYAGIPTARYDNGSPLDQVSMVQDVTQRGGSVYLVGDSGELNHIRDSDRSFLLIGAEKLGVVEPLDVTVLRLHVPVVRADFPMQNQRQISFGNQIELLGYDLGTGSPASEKDLTLTLYWHAMKVPDHNYTVFIHVLDDSGRKIAQSDSYPAGGQFPTSTWRGNYVVRDAHQLKLSLDGSNRSYQLILGLYQNETGERLQPHIATGPLLADYVQIVGLDFRP